MNSLAQNIFKSIRKGTSSNQVRFYPRWEHRSPARVIMPEDYDESTDSVVKPVKKTKNYEGKIKDELFESPKTNSRKIKWKQPGFTQENEDNKSNKFITKNKDFVEPLTVRKAKENKAKKAPTDMLELVIDEESNFIYTKMTDNDPRIGKLLTDLKSHKNLDKKEELLLEGKRLIKDALEAGCKLQYILFSRKEEVDYLKPYLPKLGAQLYKMPYKEMQLWSDLTTNPGIMAIFKVPNIENFTPKNSVNLTVICDNVREPGNLGAILRTCAGVGCEKVILTKGCVNLWDPKVLRSAVGAHFRLKIHRKMTWNEIKPELDACRIFLADNHIISQENNSENNELLESIQKVPVLPYYSVDFSNSHNNVLIIGGETEGLSEEAFKLAADTNGIRLNVPLSNNIESLNTGTALGVIAFEIKKQLLLESKK